MPDRQGPPEDFHYRPADEQQREKGWRWIMDAEYEASWSAFDINYRSLPSLDKPLVTTHQREGQPYATVTNEGIRVLKEYAWDGSTFGREWITGIRASLIHDAGYQIMRDYELNWQRDFREAYRWDFDRLFLKTQKQDGMGWILRNVRYRAVRWWPGNMRIRGPKKD